MRSTASNSATLFTNSIKARRGIFVRYTRSPHDAAVAYAIATGIIDRQEVPEDLLEHLALALEFHARSPSEE